MGRRRSTLRSEDVLELHMAWRCSTGNWLDMGPGGSESSIYGRSTGRGTVSPLLHKLYYKMDEVPFLVGKFHRKAEHFAKRKYEAHSLGSFREGKGAI